ncbi:uncharacterized protein LOC141699722 [Apium graveolens]|uniref:uncharacterized protein LOC141699722 n=1 Tax=Apium graveolens TaxID=4045 RepID=UPI003D7A6315
MEARYYLNQNVLNAELGNNPSYVWRGIVQGLAALKAGARRKIGNGEGTMVWDVPWLPDVENGFISTLEHDQRTNVKVSNLMVAGEKRWDAELLYDVFCSRDAELIRRIPIPMGDNADSWYWMLDDKGVFTVKSCYRWIQGECSNDYSDMWKKLWAIKLPEKVTNFLWRLCKGCLPTNVALLSRHVDIDARYETIWEIFARIFQRSTRDQSVEIAMEAQIKEKDRRNRDEVGERIWKPPAAGWLKINIDVALFLNGNIGVGDVIRDENSRFVAARGKKIAGAWKAREAEAIGLKEALSWVIDRGYKQCVIETDSYALAAACNGRPGEALFGTIVMDCIQLLKHINQVLVVFIYRSANSVVHRLAKAAYFMSDAGSGMSLHLSSLIMY